MPFWTASSRNVRRTSEMSPLIARTRRAPAPLTLPNLNLVRQRPLLSASAPLQSRPLLAS
eukprot:3388078-Pleurochrysis_carterae.AAC.1